MNVEFIGLPGSGKTTLSRNVLTACRNAGESRYLSSQEAYLEVAKVKIDRIFRRPLRVLPHSIALKLSQKFSYRSVKQAEAQVEFLASYGAALGAFTSSSTYRAMAHVDRIRVIDSFLSTGSYWQFLMEPETENKVVLFEEGLVQKSFMFVDYVQRADIDESHIVNYLEHIPLPKLIVYVVASIDEAFARMVARPDGLTQRLKLADGQAIRQFLKSAQDHLNFVSGWLRTRHPDRLFTVTNHDDGRDPSEALREKIETL